VVRKLVRDRSGRSGPLRSLIWRRPGFGKSTALGVIVTVLTVVSTMPYITLQLQSVTLSFSVFAAADGPRWAGADLEDTGLWIACVLALFTILFGTRTLDGNERHHGVVMAIAVEAAVKLVALLAVGIFVVWGIAGGLGSTLDRIDASQIAQWEQPGGRWAGLIFLSAAAFLCLPRMFQVLVVENADERHLATASWAFPLYLMAMSLFVVPIAVIGLERTPATPNPDLFVLTQPLQDGREGLATLAFLGGLSSATSIVIEATTALATMVQQLPA
jgi:Na+/proline symporter